MRFLPPYLLGVINSFTFFVFVFDFLLQVQKATLLKPGPPQNGPWKAVIKTGYEILGHLLPNQLFLYMNVYLRAPCCFARVCFIDTHHNLKQNLPNSTSPSIPHFSILNNDLHTKCQSVFLAKRKDPHVQHTENQIIVNAFLLFHTFKMGIRPYTM